MLEIMLAIWIVFFVIFLVANIISNNQIFGAMAGIVLLLFSLFIIGRAMGLMEPFDPGNEGNRCREGWQPQTYDLARRVPAPGVYPPCSRAGNTLHKS